MIILLTLITAAVHLILLNIGILRDKGSIDILFTLNGLGYLALLGALLYNFPAGRERLVHYAFIAFTLVTVIAWLVLNGDFSDPISLFTKAVEVLLIVLLWMNLQRA
jgi:hypothetical protein